MSVLTPQPLRPARYSSQEPSSSGVERFAQVAVLARLGRAGGLFTYRVPNDLLSVVQPGTLVSVPFSHRHLQGVVIGIETTSDLPRVRDIAEVLDTRPVVNQRQLDLARWIGSYYGASLSDALKMMLPRGIDRKPSYTLSRGTPVENRRLTAEQTSVLQLIPESGDVPLSDLERLLPDVAGVSRACASLIRRGIVVRRAQLSQARVRRPPDKILTLTPQGKTAIEKLRSSGRASKKLAVFEFLQNNGPLTQKQLSQSFPASRGRIPALHKEGLVEIEERAGTGPTLTRNFPLTSPLNLSNSQSDAYRAIAEALLNPRNKIFLLHGVTGSGKTEVYLQAAAETLRLGRQVIMMVPEIALTPQATERVAGRFPGSLAVLHSKLSEAERLDEWERIRRGEADIVVGPRSALFAPLRDVGLIVVDEEHDASYKQDASPRYNARDSAFVLGRLSGATVVLGSATPDIATYQAAVSGKIDLLSLPGRPQWSTGQSNGAEAVNRSMPPVEVVDLRHELKSGNRRIFSRSLCDALAETLSHHCQALLFLNRRGSASVVLCRDCGYVMQCRECDIPLTYHSAGSHLLCHRCDARVESPVVCPACNSRRIRYLGVGTQRVQEEVQRLFPQARVMRWDRDVTSGKAAHEKILRQFENHEADILVGTQMIAKGLDLPLVTLVGVVSADTGLHLPDFRAPERSFQLLTQVAGRAGRASVHKGRTLPDARVIVQTYTPEHYAIQAAKDHDYTRFYQQELEFRRTALYPPFARLVRFVNSVEPEEQARRGAEELRRAFIAAMDRDGLAEMEIIGPAPCFIARTRNLYHWQLIVRSASNVKGLHRLMDYVPSGWTVDVDPVDLL